MHISQIHDDKRSSIMITALSKKEMKHMPLLMNIFKLIFGENTRPNDVTPHLKNLIALIRKSYC